MRGHFSRWLTAIIFIVGLCGVVMAAQMGTSEEITLVRGRSTIVRAPWPTVRVAVTDPTVADVQVLTPEQVLVQGLKVGSTDLILWSEDEQQTYQRRVVVRLDLENIQKSLQRLFPTAELEVSDSGEILLVQGLLRTADQAVQLQDYLEKAKVSYVNTTSLAGLQQVQLQVRVAEVGRAAMRQLGINAVHTSEDFFFGQKVGGVAPSIDIGPAGQTFASPRDFDNLVFESGAIASGSGVTLFGGFPKADLELFIQALAQNQYMRILANPTLVALSGEEASFLAGGEFPIPVPQTGAAGGAGTITIQYREFGVRLFFRPVVLGDGGIRLYATQEVSELTQVGAVEIEGYFVPGLTTRRAESTVELKSGQSFALAGLLRTTDSAINARIPGLGDLPIIGPLFRSVQYRNEETELVVLVTAELVEPMTLAKAPPLPGALHKAPNDWELYLEGRLQGKEPARLDDHSRAWLKEMGLAELTGPGAWDTYEEQDFNAQKRVAEAEQRSDPTKGGRAAPRAERRKTNAADKKLPWDYPVDLPAM